MHLVMYLELKIKDFDVSSLHQFWFWSKINIFSAKIICKSKFHFSDQQF